MLPELIYKVIENVGCDLYIKALQKIPRDVKEAIGRGLEVENQEGNKIASQILFTIVENIRVAEEQATLVCQDTGLPLYKILLGTKSNLDPSRIKESLHRACQRATVERPLRSSCVHPLTRQNTGTNTGQGIPVIYFEFVEGSDQIEIHMAPKGSGSENMSFLKMLDPSAGIQGIKKFVLQCIFESGARPCPPVIVGVGLGGTADVAMHLAKEASTFRKIGSLSSDPEVAKLEKQLLEEINQTGLGPQGLGGATTALAVNVEWAHTHISQNPVAVNMQCWRGERAEAVINADGTVSWK